MLFTHTNKIMRTRTHTHTTHMHIFLCKIGISGFLEVIILKQIQKILPYNQNIYWCIYDMVGQVQT